MFGLEDHGHAVMDKNDAGRGCLGEQGTGKHLAAGLSCPDGPKAGEDDSFRIRCGDEVGLFDLPARIAPELFVLVLLVPSTCRHQASHTSQTLSPGRFFCNLFGSSIEGQRRWSFFLPPVGYEPPSCSVEFYEGIISFDDNRDMGCRSHVVAWFGPVPIPAINCQDY